MRHKDVHALIKSKHALDNFAFYSCSQGQEILNSKNYSPGIIDFLDGEHETIQQVLTTHKTEYDALLEVGCGHARNINLSMHLGLSYFGIDFIEKAVRRAQQKILENNLTGQANCISVLDLNHETTPVPSFMRTVCLFPFNVFGNIFEPLLVIKKIHALNYTMLISTYRHDAERNAVLNYYEACGLNHIKTITLSNGTMYISKEGFKSIIYNSGYIHHLVKQLGLTIETFEFSTFGKLYYIR